MLPKALRALLTVNVVIYLLWLVFLLPPLRDVGSVLAGYLVLYRDRDQSPETRPDVEKTVRNQRPRFKED